MSQVISPSLTEFIRNLRGALPYLEEYHSELVVVYLSGETLQQPNLSSILDDLVLLYRVGLKIILVHGAEPQVQALLQQQGLPASYSEDRQIIDASRLPLAQQAIASANWDLLTRLSGYGDDIFPFSGHVVQAQKKQTSLPVDYHFSGDIREIDVKCLKRLTDQEYLPVLAPLGVSGDGLWVLEPNQLAMEVAVRLRARKLVILTAENEHLLQAAGHIGEMKTKEVNTWLKAHPEISHVARLQALALVEACERGVERCHLLDSGLDGALLGEILTSIGMGLMVTDSPYERTRPAKISDLPAVLEILEQPVKDLAIIHKSRAYLESHIEHFWVFCIDDELVGCCELIPFQENLAMEIASFAVKATHRNRGIGRHLIQAAISQAKQANFKMVFALSTRASQVFLASGFKEIDPDLLPEVKRRNYDFHASLIYAKGLS